MAKEGQKLELVSIEFTKAKKINDDLHIVWFLTDFYNVRYGNIETVPFNNFQCYSSQEALDNAMKESIRLAKEENERKRRLEVEREKERAKEAMEQQIAAEAEMKHQAELKAIRVEAEQERKAALEIARIKAEDERKIRELEKSKDLARLKEKYSSFAKECVLSDAERVKNHVTKIQFNPVRKKYGYRPDRYHLESQEIISMNFYEYYITIPYRFKFRTEMNLKNNKYSSKGIIDIGPNSERALKKEGIHIKLGWSTATAKCLLPKE